LREERIDDKATRSTLNNHLFLGSDWCWIVRAQCHVKVEHSALVFMPKEREERERQDEEEKELGGGDDIVMQDREPKVEEGEGGEDLRVNSTSHKRSASVMSVLSENGMKRQKK